MASPRVDAELLASHVLSVPRGRLPVVRAFTPEQATRFESLVARRAAREPLQHITGEAPFHGLSLAVGPGVFIPRFETELLVEWALRQPASRVVDLCSGSGAIAVAFAANRPSATVLAVERSPAALPWLRRNVAALAPAVSVVEGDVTDSSVLSDVDGLVDLVLCNPPYVPSTTPVDPEVRDHDPAEAVFAGTDGLALMPAIAARAAALLRPGGLLAIEHDDTQGESLPALLRGFPFTDVVDHTDLAGRPRFTTARRVAD
ncbi:peptide chain release factor N(5)-glutamine methyltransferase [Dactylosporangium sp. AC04546]|nr:peptide chain release factor N(5)-glutamine methyltransferase [Dactylosporangium sp. AC04546]WVK85053.1 peptide chain release factor N(5)-glutamine methyltransferase [Dactylosporangium sp. AC04546]